MPYLETEEEAAENIADINERRYVRKNEINLNDIDDLINEIDKYKYKNALVSNNDDDDYKVVSFKNLFDFINDIKDGKINNLNKKKTYEDRISEIENKLFNTENNSKNVNLYKKIY